MQLVFESCVFNCVQLIYIWRMSGGKMAAAELKQEAVSTEETPQINVPAIGSHREIECYQFRVIDIVYYSVSLGLFLADIATDSITFVEYLLQGNSIWGYVAMCLTFLPTGIIQLFSLRWYHSDGSLKTIHWIVHFLFLGVLHRYLVLLYTALRSLRSKQPIKDKNWVYRQESDVCMLSLFESFMGAAPQLTLKLYILAVSRSTSLWTSVSATVSFCSLTWAIGAYTKAMHKLSPAADNSTWIALSLQGIWRVGTLVSRIAALVLTALFLRERFFVLFGLHWLFMTVWVVLQNTDFCPTAWEERIYNCIIGLIYCFDFFNLRVGKSRYRVFVFYSAVVTENLISLMVYGLYFKDTSKISTLIVLASLIVGGMFLGLTSMLFYYGKFHPSKRKRPSTPKPTSKDSRIAIDKAGTPRSLKQYYSSSFASLPRSIDQSERAVSEEVTTDKQYLLTNVAQISESTEDGIINRSCNVENESKTTAMCIVSECEISPREIRSKTENGSVNSNTKPNPIPDPLDALRGKVFSVSDSSRDYELDCTSLRCCDSTGSEVIHRQKRRAICLPSADGLDIDRDLARNDGECRLPSEKRRGICSSAQFILEMKNGAGERFPVNAEDSAESVAENAAKIRERLSTPTRVFHSDKVSEIDKFSKEMHQRDETMSCVTSIHDYENVCPLGVARPPWCIRSWKGYTDIETYIHDDSVVRDRRRDTLTSTTTGTTYSSDFSDTTCANSILRGILKQDDYLDTLTYDLVEPRELKPIYTDKGSVKKTSNLDLEQSATLYIAKPVVMDDKGGMFALGTILEEHDEISTEEKLEYIEPTRDSVSTLVSTIDQIRKLTAENSPRHVYHTTGTQWEEEDPKAFLKRALFRNDLHDSGTPNRNYKSHFSESGSIVPGKCEIDAIKELVKYCTIESIRKTPLIDAILSDSPILGNKTKNQKQVALSHTTNLSGSSETDLYVEMSPLVPLTNIQVVHNKVSDRTSTNTLAKSDVILPEVSSVAASTSSTKDSVNRNSIDRNETLDACENRKRIINYPKRKFSLLKERFEPKSQLVYVVTPNRSMRLEQSDVSPITGTAEKNLSMLCRKSTDFSARHDKENLAPASVVSPVSPVSPVLCKTDSPNNLHEETSPGNKEGSDALIENDATSYNPEFTLKERRHTFLEQVLSPPKLFTWTKRKSLVTATKET